MEKIKIKKIDATEVLKSTLIIFGILGIIAGVIIGITQTPCTTVTQINGEIIKTQIETGIWLRILTAALGVFTVIILSSLCIPFMAVIFNWYCKLSGGITLYIEKEHI